jgi:hypothetical protein
VSVLNPENKALKPLPGIFKSIKSKTKKLQSICEVEKLKESSPCPAILKEVLALLSKGEKLIAIPPKLQDKKNFTPEDLLISFDQSFQFQSQYKNLITKFQTKQFHWASKSSIRLPFHQLIHEIEICENLFNDYLIKSSDGRFRKEFLSFWSDFVKPVNNLILPGTDLPLFIRKLNELNLRLNFLNVALTKRNKKINKQALLLLKIMHNRWNNILKTTLRR